MPVLRLAAPLVVSFSMRAAFTMVDTVYAALIGDAAVAAIGLTVPFEFLMIAIWVGLLTGLTSALSRAFGARDEAAADRSMAAAWRLVLGAAAAFMALGATIWFAAPRLGLTPDVGRSFQLYGSVLGGGGALTTFWAVIPDSVVKAHHDMRSPMWAGIALNVLNLGFNTLFVFGLEWGIFGIALGAGLGKIGGLVYALRRARVHEERRWRTALVPAPAAGAAPAGAAPAAFAAPRP